MTVTDVPRGLVRFGVTTMRIGDRLQPEQLPALVYVPEPGFSGPAGAFQYLVEDGRGGRAEGALDIEVMDPAEAAAQMAEAAVWDRLRSTGRPEDVETFLRVYPTSYLAPAAERRRQELLGQAAAAAQPAAPPAAPALASPPLARPAPAQIAASGAVPASMPPVKPATAPDKLAALQPSVPPTQSQPQRGREVAIAMPAVTPPIAAAPPTNGDRTFQDCPTCVTMVRIPPAR